MKRTTFLWMIFATVPALSGCINSEYEYTINPDGSGKLKFRTERSPDTPLGRLGSPGEVMELYIKRSIGARAWKDLSCKAGEDNKYLITGTAYFDDYRAFRLKPPLEYNNTDYDVHLTINKNGAMEFHMPKEPDKDKNRKPTEEEIIAEMRESRSEWANLFPTAAPLAKGYKRNIVYNLPGTIDSAKGFTKEKGNRLSLTLDGEAAVKIYDKTMEDEAELRNLITTGKNMLSRKYFGDIPSATIKTPGKPLFDYEAEVNAADTPEEAIKNIKAKK